MKLAINLKCLNNNLDYNYNDKINGFINKIIKDSNVDNHNSKKIGKFTFHLDFSLNKRVKFNKSGIYIPSHSTHSNIILYVSSSNREFIKYLNNNININGLYNFGKLNFIVNDIQFQDFDYKDKNIFYLSLLNPVIVRDSNNKCLSPDDSLYLKYLKNNIVRKLDNHLDDKDFIFKILREKGLKKKIIKVKGGLYTGYIYDFFINFKSLSSDSIYNILEDGFGSMNSQGFGFVEIKNCN